MGRKALDVLKMICDQIGWDQIVTVENEDTLTKDDRKLVRALNRTLRVLSGVNDWRFLRTEGEIITVAQYTLGTVRLTNGSTTVTGQNDPATVAADPPVWTADMAGRALLISGSVLTYRIVSVDSPTSLTINRAWQGTTTNGTTEPDKYYRIVQDRYDMPTDMCRPVDEDWSLYTESDVRTVKVKDARFVRARRDDRATPYVVDQEPDVVTIWDTDEQGEHRVAILDPPPLSQRVVTFPYQKLHPEITRDTQRLLFAPRYEEIIADGVEFLIKEGPDDDARAEMALSEFLRSRSEGASTREVGERRRRISPSQWRAYHQRTKWGRRGLRTDWGSYFDRKDFYDL